MATWEWIGRVGKPLGLNGFFSLSGQTALIDEPAGPIKIGTSLSSARLCELSGFQIRSARAYLRLSLAEDRSSVESLAGLDLWAESSGSLNDLIGRQIKAPNGTILGEAAGFDNFGASDVITIHNQTTQKVLDLPFIETYFDFNRLEDPEFLYLTVDPDDFADLWSNA